MNKAIFPLAIVLLSALLLSFGCVDDGGTADDEPLITGDDPLAVGGGTVPAGEEAGEPDFAEDGDGGEFIEGAGIADPFAVGAGTEPAEGEAAAPDFSSGEGGDEFFG